MEEHHVGWLVGYNTIICDSCLDTNQNATPVYGINIRPYKQTCAKCGAVLVESLCCELFTGKEY